MKKKKLYELVNYIRIYFICSYNYNLFLFWKKSSTQGKIVITESELSKIIREERDDAIKRSRAVIGGLFSEQLAPYLPDFKYNPNEVRFIGKPIDFIVFKGMNEKEITEVVFVEVKNEKSRLTSQERKLRDAIKEGKVTWEEYRIPKEITEIQTKK